MAGLAKPEALLERACAASSLSDFGAKGWREGLELLIEVMAEQPLTASGVTRVENQIVRALTARLLVEDWIGRHPECAGGAIDGPTVIMGLPRTGTTAMAALLANDPRWRYLRGWEVAEPCPPPDLATEATDPRSIRERNQAQEDVSLTQHIHEAGGPVDDAAVLRMDFRNQELGWPAWKYTRWWRDCDMSTTYAYHARVLRLLQSRRPPNRWLVKAPWHNFHLDDLVGVYPDTKFIMCHRDPAKLVASVASLLRTTYRMVIPEDKIDTVGLGRFVLEHLRASVSRVMDFRRRHGDAQFIDVHHDAFNGRPSETVESIYRRMGLELTPNVRLQMSAWVERNRKGVHGEHRYSAEEFGLTEPQIRDAFADYMQHFDLTEREAAG